MSRDYYLVNIKLSSSRFLWSSKAQPRIGISALCNKCNRTEISIVRINLPMKKIWKKQSIATAFIKWRLKFSKFITNLENCRRGIECCMDSFYYDIPLINFHATHTFPLLKWHIWGMGSKLAAPKNWKTISKHKQHQLNSQINEMTQSKKNILSTSLAYIFHCMSHYFIFHLTWPNPPIPWNCLRLKQ